MNTMKFFMVALMCMMVSNVCLAGDHIISPKQLPKAAQQYIRQYHPGQIIVYAEVDYDFGRPKYEVKLMNGIELKFDARGYCYKIEFGEDYRSVRRSFPARRHDARKYHDYDDDDDFDDFDD